MKINQPAVAGTLESGDVMIRIAPLDTQDIDLQINSSVEKQFGDAIRTTILDVLARYNVRGVQLNVDDKGALDCILRARLEALSLIHIFHESLNAMAYRPCQFPFSSHRD